MASLRVRLLAGLLALTAAGMLIAGGVTYAEQPGQQARPQGHHHVLGRRRA